jgi:hypothetical protein
LGGLTLALAITACGADLTPFNGAWKFNPQKSKLAGDTMTFRQGADGMLVQTMRGMDISFRVDGKDYPTPMGMTVSWKEAGRNAWDLAFKVNGEVQSTAHVEITPDNKTVAYAGEYKKPNGETYKETARYVRVSGGDGLIGTWRSEKVDMPAQLMRVKTSGGDFTMELPDWEASIEAKLDGKPYPLKGKMVPPNLTFVLRPVDARTVEVVTAASGKTIATSQMVVSADGKTLTETDKSTGQVYVYEKQ